MGRYLQGVTRDTPRGRGSNKADPKSGFNENQAEIEYYMAK